MPELPEVETVKLGLQSIIFKKIEKVIVNCRNFRIKTNHDLAIILKNNKILAIERRAKYLIFTIENKGFLIFHLGMSGIITLNSNNYIAKKHDHILIFLKDSILVFNDPRRFGLCVFYKKLDNINLFKNLGIEPLSYDFSKDYLFAKLKKSNQKIKPFLMNNKIVVGIGNIYASESLFLAKIHPEKLAKDLTKNESNRLQDAIKNILTMSINNKGTSLKDYKTANGYRGNFQNNLNVYNRKNCKTCNALIVKKLINQRMSYFCENCQL